MVITEIRQLKEKYPDAHCALDHNSPFQLLIATLLSAQCTDERVNIVTRDLFKKYPTAESMNRAPQKEIEQIIKSTGFYKNKSKNIKKTCEILVNKYKGEIPQTLGELTQLSGVGRKTANVVLGNAFGIVSGVVVDTHVLRLSQRLGWIKVKDAIRAERALMNLIPKKEWILISHLLITHGRLVCKARSPKCKDCFLSKDCPKVGVKLF